MAWHDPFPRQEFLTAREVRKLFGLSRHDELQALMADHPHFPKMVQVGKTAKGKPRYKFPKGKIFAFIDLMGS